jgi:hypothetical protein
MIGLGAETTGDAFSEWLAAPPLPNATDQIASWIAMEAASHPLAWMALDFLSAPGISLIFIGRHCPD